MTQEESEALLAIYNDIRAYSVSEDPFDGTFTKTELKIWHFYDSGQLVHLLEEAELEREEQDRLTGDKTT